VLPANASYLHRDAQGSVRQITTAAGVSDQRRFYLPYGAVSLSTVAVTNPAPDTKGWIGERFDADAGLQYLNARYYDPQLGMFLQPDWWEVMQPGVGTNRYSYSFGDPVNGIDPSGHRTVVREDKKTAREDDFKVESVSKDGDLRIYIRDGAGNTEKSTVLGKTRFWDSFIGPDTGDAVGTVYEGHSFNKRFATLGILGKTKGSLGLAINSLPYMVMDVKNSKLDEYTSYSGVMLNGKYMTLREIGNVLAGYNAAGNGQTFDKFHKVSGALHKAGPLGSGPVKDLAFGVLV
jgi:RHS repeat-associated protein